MHAQLDTPSGFALMGADTPPAWTTRPRQPISISLSGDDADALRGYCDEALRRRRR